MESKALKMLKVEPHKPPYKILVCDDLHSLQNEVHGFIEIIHPFDDDEDVVIICNEEGKLYGLEGNRMVGGDIIAGDFLIAMDGNDGELASLTDALIVKYTEMFEADETYTPEEVEDSVYIELYEDVLDECDDGDDDWGSENDPDWDDETYEPDVEDDEGEDEEDI